MRKLSCLALGTFLISFLVISCKKENVPSTRLEISREKINSWLEGQKSPSQPLKASNIELLKNNLDFSGLTIEESAQNERIVIVPIDKKFKALKKIDQKSMDVLVLLVDATGKIRKGNVVLYTPSKPLGQNKIPTQTFYAIYNTSHPRQDGQFRYLSVTGRWLYDLNYKQNNLAAVGKIQQKISAPTRVDGVSAITCIDWYLVTTFYENGIPVAQTSEYVGTTCSGCDTEMYQGFCNDNSGGGGNETGYEYEEERILRATTINVIYWFATGDGGGTAKSTHALQGKFYRVKTQNDRIISCYMQTYGVYNNTMGADCAIHTHNLSSLGKMLVGVSIAGQMRYPDNTYFNFTSNFNIDGNHLIWTP